MHTSRSTHHNRITQVVIWLADYPPEVMGRHSLSAIHNNTERRRIVYRFFYSDRDVCWHLFGGREGVAGNTIHTPGVRATWKYDCGGEYTAVFVMSSCSHNGVCRRSPAEVKSIFHTIFLSLKGLPVISGPLLHSCVHFIWMKIFESCFNRTGFMCLVIWLAFPFVWLE